MPHPVESSMALPYRIGQVVLDAILNFEIPIFKLCRTTRKTSGYKTSGSLLR